MLIRTFIITLLFAALLVSCDGLNPGDLPYALQGLFPEWFTSLSDESASIGEATPIDNPDPDSLYEGIFPVNSEYGIQEAMGIQIKVADTNDQIEAQFYSTLEGNRIDQNFLTLIVQNDGTGMPIISATSEHGPTEILDISHPPETLCSSLTAYLDAYLNTGSHPFSGDTDMLISAIMQIISEMSYHPSFHSALEDLLSLELQ